MSEITVNQQQVKKNPTLIHPDWALPPPRGAVRGWTLRWQRTCPTWPTRNPRSCSETGLGTVGAERWTGETLFIEQCIVVLITLNLS